MNSREKIINELRFQLDSKEVKDQHYPVQLSASDANAILAMLKEQEPQVLTLEELDTIYNTEKTHVWPFNRSPYLWMTINPDVRLTSGYWICWRDIMYSLENNNPFYVRENYEKVWKIWTARLTDEQREAVKWDG